jgi:tRNA threonylcarbamoyladenosine biosynthesis protein TsaE
MRHLKTSSASETFAEGVTLGKNLQPNAVLAFFGDLGAGKTTLIKGIVSGATGLSPDTVTSPTFTYLQIYPGNTPVYHFDLYRLRTAADFLSLGFSEYFKAGGICCIEWSERIEDILPPGTLRISLKHVGEEQREITVL